MDRFDWLEFDRLKTDRPQEAPRLRREPDDARSFLRAARQMRRFGYPLSAASYYEHAVGMEDHLYDAWVELIDALVRARALDRAEARSREAIESYRKVRHFYAARALVLAHHGRYIEAVELAETAIQNGDPAWYPFCVRAEIELRLGVERRFDALRHYEAAFDCAEADWQPYYLAGWALLEARLPALAAGMFAEAGHHDPHSAVCWMGLGDSFLALHLYDQASFYYQRVTELDPRNETALERQRRCASLPYGLLNALAPRATRDRWKRKFRRLVDQWGPRNA